MPGPIPYATRRESAVRLRGRPQPHPQHYQATGQRVADEGVAGAERQPQEEPAHEQGEEREAPAFEAAEPEVVAAQHEEAAHEDLLVVADGPGHQVQADSAESVAERREVSPGRRELWER